jgi:hypothetical protein
MKAGRIIGLTVLCIVAMVVVPFTVFGVETPGNSKLIVKDGSSNTQFQVTDTGQFTLGNFASTTFSAEMRRTGVNAAFVVNRTDGAQNFINATAAAGQFGTVNNFPVRILVNAAVKEVLNADNSVSWTNGASITAAGVVVSNPSSRSLKENISDLTSETALETLKNLSPVSFDYKINHEHHLGFIAEDVPSIVAMPDRKGLNPMDIVAVLTKVVKDKGQVIDSQQKTIDMMAAKLEKLEAEMNRLMSKDYSAQK